MPPPASRILGMAEVYDTEVTRVLPFPHTVPNFAGLTAAAGASPASGGGTHKETGKEKEKPGKEKDKEKEKEKEKQPSYPTTTGAMPVHVNEYVANMNMKALVRLRLQ